MLPRKLRVLDEVSFTWIVDDVGVFLSYFEKVHIIRILWLVLLAIYSMLTVLLLLNVHLIHKHSVLILVYALVLVKWSHSSVEITSRTASIEWSCIILSERHARCICLLHTPPWICWRLVDLVIVLEILSHNLLLMISCQETFLDREFSDILSPFLNTHFLFLHTWL